MKYYSFANWCESAVKRIRFGPDRKRVYSELYSHMEDEYDALVCEGLSDEDAKRKVLRSMGDAEQTADQLALIHRPFWGWMLRAARILLIISALIALRYVPGYINTHIHDYQNSQMWVFEDVKESSSGSSRMTFYTEPKCQSSSDGFTFRITRAAQRHSTYTTDGITGKEDSFYLMVDVSNPRPWMDSGDIMREFYAVDSLGNKYVSTYDQIYVYEPYLAGNGIRSNLFTTTWLMWLQNYCSQDAEWIELRYDRSGRDIRLRIDLTGGVRP